MSDPAFRDTDTLGAARTWLRDQIQGDGAKCPCCRQMAKVYRRGINAGQAAILVRWWRQYGTKPVMVAEQVKTPGGDYAKLRYWGLVEDMHARREDGGPAGQWRVTDLGEMFAASKVAIPRFVYVYDNRLLRVDESESITIQEALGKRFDYDELMSAPGTS